MTAVFIGSIQFSWYCLKEILEKNLAEVVGVFNVDPQFSNGVSDYKNQEDLAKKFNVPHFFFRNINDKEIVDSIKKLSPDLILVFGLSQIIKKELLDIPPLGVIGTHPTLLPENRGRAPIPWSIIKGLKKSGLTMLYLGVKADQGDIVAQSSWKINDSDDASTLYNKMILAGIQLLNKTLPLIASGKAKRIKQPKESNWWSGRKPEDGKISWNDSYLDIDKLIRATTKPYPGAFCYYKGKKIIIWGGKPRKTRFSAKFGEVIKSINKGIEVQAKGGSILITKWEPQLSMKSTEKLI